MTAPTDHPIKVYRRENGLTLVQAGELLGVSEMTVWRWENGRRTPRRRELQKIKAEFGIAPSAIVNFEPAGSAA